MIIAAMLGALTFGACVDNNESESVENVRNAKAEELKSLAALNNAKAQAELIAANAEAALKASQAAINEAEAAIKEAKARYEEALAEAQEIKNEQDRALLEAKIAEYEAEIAKWQMLKAQYVAQMERDAVTAEKALIEAQLGLLKKEQEFNAELDKIEAAEALVLKQLYQQYASEARNLNTSIGSLNRVKSEIALAEADIVSAEEAAAKAIARYEEQIAADEAQIALLQEFLAVIVENHGDEILSDEEVKELYEKTYVEYLKYLEAYQVALDAQTAAGKVVTDAQKACSDIKSTSLKDGLGTTLRAAREAYFEAADDFVEAGGLLKLVDDMSAATGNTEATSYGFYTTDKLTGVNSVYNEIITIAAQPALNTDKEDDVLDGTYEYELWTINEKNLEAYVTALKGNKATAEQIAKFEKDVKDAQAAYDKAVAAVEPAEKAAETAKAAYVKAAEAEVAANKALADYTNAWDGIIPAIDEKQAELYTAWVEAKTAYDKTVAAYNAAVKANEANPTNANALKVSEANTEMLKAKNTMDLASNEHDTYFKNRQLNIDQAQLALGDGTKEQDAVKAAAAAKDKAAFAYKLALKALGQAPQYTADGSWDTAAKYLTGDFTYKYDAGKKVYYIDYAFTYYADKAAYLASKEFSYVDANGKTQKVVAAHVDVVAKADDLAKAEKTLAGAKDNNSEFVENVDKLIADLKETAAAFEAAAKAYNEAWVVAAEALAEAEAAKEVADKAVEDANTALNAVDDVLSSIGIQHTECATIYKNLTNAIAVLEAQIERWKASIEAAAADTTNIENYIAVKEAELAILEVEVEVQTIYVETAKAALDAALAEYAQSGETEE